MYQQGDLILQQLRELPTDAVPMKVETRSDGGIDLGRGHVLCPSNKDTGSDEVGSQ
jgi:hypothetical protein